MRIFTKLVFRLCFVIWILFAILPWEILTEYTLFSILFKTGLCISITVFVMAIIAFIVPLLQKENKKAVNPEKGKFILHDIDIDTADKIFNNVSNAEIYNAGKMIAKCNGCYGCWLTTPSLCVIHDGVQAIGKQIACCDELIIISKNLYGGYTQKIKNALDRSISFSLPFFAVRNKEQHHQLRYSNDGKIRVYIYNSNEVTETDKLTLMEITKANSINMNINDYETVFINDIKEICEVLK